MPLIAKETRESKASTHKATTDIEVLGVDARWQKYGAYIKEFLQIVQVQWNRILREERISPQLGSSVVVTFKINSRGETDILKVEDAGAGKKEVVACLSAITYPQPYRKWTDPMIAEFGDEQEFKFTFRYQ
jgi:hypothetical protein